MVIRDFISGSRIKTWIAIGFPVVILFLFRRSLLQVGILILGAAVLTFLTLPLARWYEKKLSRPLASLAGILTVAAVLIGGICLILPVMIRQISDLASLLPHSVSVISAWFESLAAHLHLKTVGTSLSDSIMKSAGTLLPDVAAGTIAFAGSLADITGRASLMVVLSYFFLADREMILLRLEMAIPSRQRAMTVRMGNAVIREMRMYLRGQLTIAAAVAVLSAVGLAVLRIPGALALGPIIGILNMIPYFGPFIGGIPAVLAALADGWQKALMALCVILIVQQLDNNFISPRVMGGLTGMSPAFVLIAVFAGSQIAGVVGMLLALPTVMTFRTLFRVFVQRHENI
ncbi:MAG: AI-2E family transporter [Clostridia bacterium]|nr:AI-2E family transporter [Clostridia bacterium]